MKGSRREDSHSSRGSLRTPVLLPMVPWLQKVYVAPETNTPHVLKAGAARAERSEVSGAVALLELFAAATRARIVTTNVFQGVAHRLLWRVPAVRAVYMAVIVVMMVMIVVAVWAMNVGLLGHYSITLE